MKRMIKKRLLLLAAITSVLIGLLALPGMSMASPTSSYVLYGVNSGDDGLSIINPNTGEITFIGPLNPDPNIYATPVAMAVRQSDNEIFVWNNSNVDPNQPNSSINTGVLLKIDKTTGLATQIGSETNLVIGALAFSQVTGKLYGLGTSPNNGLYEIDTTSGTPTLIQDYATSFNIYAADCDSSGTIHGILVSNQKIVAIDPSNGNYTLGSVLSEDIGVIGSIVFDPEGNLLGSGFAGPQGRILFHIDINTGEVSNIIQTEPGIPQGMGFVQSDIPNQAPIINAVTADPDQLWPPNHKAVDVTISVDAIDPDGSDDIVRITYSVNDEYWEYNVAETDLPENGIIFLIADRDGKDKDGRVYTITIKVYDAGGLSNSSNVDVVVSHDQGKKGK